MICNKCGTQLPDANRFCTKCGNVLDNTAKAEQKSGRQLR